MGLLLPETGLLLWQLFIFVALLFLLRKFAWKPILKGLKDRETSIDEALKAAEEAKEEMKRLKADNDKLYEEARNERDKILKQAMDAANTIREEARNEATKISAKMIEDTKSSIENEKKAALAELKNYTAQLSLQVAEKLLRKNLSDDKAQQELVEDFIKELNLN